MKINEVGEYIQECLRLLYWVYFKHYTLEKWLQDIHPQLDTITNPFSLRSDFRQNPRLQRYANHAWWITAIVPILAVLIVAPIYSLFADRSFEWLPSGLFLLGWIGGLWFVRGDFGRWSNRLLLNVIYICLGSILLWKIGSFILPSSIQQLIQHTFTSFISTPPFLSVFISVALYGAVGMTFGIAFGIASGIVFGMTFGIASGIVFGIELGIAVIAFSIALGIAFGIVFGMMDSVTSGLKFGVMSGVMSGVVSGLKFGVMSGVVSGLKFGVVSGVAFILGVSRVYCWIPEFFWMIGLSLMLSQGNAASVLRRLPPYFDQRIFIPLPFIAEIIIKAHRQNPIAARSTIDYFITSTNQQAVANKAMFGIGIETLNQCRYVSDIIGSQIQLDWLPTDEKTFGKVLPRLLEISHNIDIAYQATTAYNKLELVDRSISDLQKLQTSLSTAASASDAPLFGTITMRWLQILQDNRQALETAAQASAEIPNPYLAGSSLEPADAKERFKGRQDLFREIEKISLSAQPPVLLLYGRRRTGKTSTLKYLPSRVISDLIPLLVDFQGVAMIQRMENVAVFMAEEITNTAKSSRNLILPKFSPEQLNSDPFYALRKWMVQIEQESPNKRFLLCIDEFERLEEVIPTSGSRAPLNFLRYVTQNCRQWIVLFSGSHRLEELEPYWSDYLIGTRTLSITYLQEAEARDLIQYPVPTFPDIYSSTAVDAILALTRGQPYLVQLLCSCIVEYINDAKRKSVTVSDVEAAKPIAWERGEGYFREFSDALTPAQRDFIHRLLAHETPHESDLMVIRQLIQSEIIEKDANGEYQFQVPLIEQYIREKIVM
jgi:uncharacterized protein